MRWFQGDIAEAVAASKSKRAVFVVFVEGKDDSSLNTAATIDDSLISSQLESDNFVAIKLDSGSESYRQFAQIYQLVPVPSIFFIGTNGVPLEVVAGNVTVPELVLRINTVLEKCGKASPQTSESKQSPEEEAGTSIQQDVQATPEPGDPEPEADETIMSDNPSFSDEFAQTLKTVEERVEHAKELLEKKRQQKRDDDDKAERNREVERRRVGQEVQKLKRWQQEQEVRELKEQRKKEKEEEQAARQRVLVQISQDRAERAARMAKEQEKEQEAKKEEQSSVERASASRRSDAARIQFRLPDGSSHTHQFPATTSLAEVRTYAATTLSLPFREFAMSTTFPRREFTPSDDSRSVDDLELTPTAVILILPAASSAVVSSPSYIHVATRTFWSLLAPITALFTYLTSWMFPRGGGSNPSRATTVEPAKTDNNTDRPQPVRRRTSPADSVTVQRQGNVHRLTNRRDSSEDENNTWNGNSTQQM